MKEHIRLRRLGIRPTWCWKCAWTYWTHRERWFFIRKCAFCEMRDVM